MEASSCSCRSGQALPPSSPITMGLPAPISPNDPLESRRPRPPWRGFQDHVYSLLAEGSPVLPHQRNPGTREMVPKWLDKKRPRRSGAKRQRVYRVLAEEGLPQQDNSGRAGSFQQERSRRSGAKVSVFAEGGLPQQSIAT